MNTPRSAALLPLLVLLSCEQPQEPDAPRSFAPRLAAVPAGTSTILVQISTSPLDGGSAGNVFRQEEAPVSQGGMTIGDLPSQGTLYFRVSGLDTGRAPIWWAARGFGSESRSSVQIGGSGGVSTSSPSAPDVKDAGTSGGTGSPSVKVSCSGGWPAWTLDGSVPGPGSGSVQMVKNQSSSQFSVSWGSTVRARCTDGWGWSQVVDWTSAASILATSPGTVLPAIQIRLTSPSGSGVQFAVPGGTNSTYSNWQVLYRTSSMSSWAQTALGSGVGVPNPGGIEAFLVAWDSRSSGWVAGPSSNLQLPVSQPGAGGSLPSPRLQVSSPTGGWVSFSTPDGFSCNCSEWTMFHQGATGSSWLQTSLGGGGNPGTQLSSPGVLTAYLAAWDSDSSRWRTSPTTSVSLPPAAPVPGRGLSAYPLFTAPASASGALFQASVPAQLTTSGTGVSEWHVISSLDGGPYQVHQQNDGWSLDSAGTVRLFVAGWVPSTNSWTTGPETSVVVPRYQVSLSAPNFSTGTGTTLSGTYVVDSSSFALQISSPSAAQILYTTDSTDPVPGRSPTWNGAQNVLTFPAGKSAMLVKAMAWSSPGQISTISRIAVSRPAWTRIDLPAVGCLRQVGLTRVYACGDGRGPLNWTGNGWTAVDPSWTAGPAQALLANDTELVAAAGARVWRASRGGPFEAVGDAIPGGTVTAVARWGDSLWAAAPDGIYEWTGSAWTLQPGSPAGVPTLWGGPDALWAGQAAQIWKFGFVGSSRSWGRWLNPNLGAIAGFAPNPWTSGGSGPLLLTSQGLAELDPQQAALSGNLVTDAASAHAGLRQVASLATNYATRIYAAFDNGSGVGGIARAAGWNSGWSPVGSDWPTENGQPIPARGIAVYKMSTTQLVATTPSGTWILPLP